MNIAFCLFKYFPYGGLQRDFLRIAELCRDRGHDVRVLTMVWEGERPVNFDVEVLPVRALTNHGKAWKFSRAVRKRLQKKPADVVVGFNKMPGLDVYFAADPCFEAKVRVNRSWFYRFGCRYWIYRKLERAVFSREVNTQILMLTEAEKRNFVRYYQTAEGRFHLLPPGINRNDYNLQSPDDVSRQVRFALGVRDDEILLLMVGSGFRTKGVDRSLAALAALPEKLRENVRLVVVGKGDQVYYEAMAAKMGVAQKVSFLGTRNDVPRILIAADILLHPSYTEAAGMVLLEAMLAGLPILCTETCGYAYHVRDAGAGLLIPVPFVQEKMNELLLFMLGSAATRVEWQRNGLSYIARTDISSLPERAVGIIESVTQRV